MNALHAQVLDHLQKTKTISVREAMDDYGLSGGHITKIISDLRRSGQPIERQFRKHPISGKRYARYFLLEKPAVSLAQANTFADFNVGDRIQIGPKGIPGCGDDYEIGSQGEVVEKTETVVKVRLDNETNALWPWGFHKNPLNREPGAHLIKVAKN